MDTPAIVPFPTTSQPVNLNAADRFLNVMNRPGTVLKFPEQPTPEDYPPLTDTIVTHVSLLDDFPLDILNYRVGRFLIVVGVRPQPDHPKLSNFLVYSTRFQGITVYVRKRG